MFKILCVGPLWRGSNANGFFQALSRAGNLIDVIDEFYYIPLTQESFYTRILSKFNRPQFIRSFNNKIVNQAKVFKPDLLFVYKGAFILPDTLRKVNDLGVYISNFFPDVSFSAHGKWLRRTLPLYDVVFTTKSFGARDLKTNFGIEKSIYIPHGFDPNVHRKIDLNYIPKTYKADVSFIGGYSKKKNIYYP